MNIWCSSVFFVGLCLGLAGCGEVSGAADNGTNVEAGELTCEVTFNLGESSVIDALEYEVSYETPVSMSVDTDGLADCTNLLPDSGVAVANVDQTLRFGRLSAGGFGGPIDLDKCRFTSAISPQPSDFAVTVTTASSGGDTLSVPPVVEVTRIDCSSTDSATSTTTTTTLSCDGIACAPGERCVMGSCALADRYDVNFSVTAGRTLGALQLDIDYPCEFGGVVRSLDTEACKLAPGLNGYAAFHVDEAEGACGSGTLTAAVIFPTTGIDTPRVLFSCEIASGARAPVPSDFKTTVVDASDPRGQSIRSVNVDVSEVRPAHALP